MHSRQFNTNRGNHPLTPLCTKPQLIFILQSSHWRSLRSRLGRHQRVQASHHQRLQLGRRDQDELHRSGQPPQRPQPRQFRLLSSARPVLGQSVQGVEGREGFTEREIYQGYERAGLTLSAYKEAIDQDDKVVAGLGGLKEGIARCCGDDCFGCILSPGRIYRTVRNLDVDTVNNYVFKSKPGSCHLIRFNHPRNFKRRGQRQNAVSRH